jgi:hypothetical protein
MLEIVVGVVYNMGASHGMAGFAFYSEASHNSTTQLYISSPDLARRVNPLAVRSSETHSTGKFCLTS